MYNINTFMKSTKFFVRFTICNLVERTCLCALYIYTFLHWHLPSFDVDTISKILELEDK